MSFLPQLLICFTKSSFADVQCISELWSLENPAWMSGGITMIGRRATMRRSAKVGGGDLSIRHHVHVASDTIITWSRIQNRQTLSQSQGGESPRLVDASCRLGDQMSYIFYFVES